MKTRNTLAVATLILAVLCFGTQSACSATALASPLWAMEAEPVYAYDTADYAQLPPFSGGEYGSDSWKLVNQIGGSAQAVYQENGILYIGSGVTVVAVKVDDPDSLMIVGMSGMLPQTIESISGDGKGNLFIACGTGGMAVLNVSDPSRLQTVGYLDTRGITERITVHGNYALIADGPQGMQVADISDRANPALVAEAYPLAYAYDIAVQGTTAYIAAGGSGILVVDIEDPKAPLEKGLVSLDGFQYGVAADNGRLYAAGAWGGVSILDLGNPEYPQVIGAIETFGWAMGVQMKHGKLFVSEGANGLRVYEPGGGQAISMYDQYVGFILDFAVLGDTAYLIDKEKGLLVVDFANQAEPALAGRWMPLTDGRRVTLDGQYCYVAGGLSGMHVYDLANPASPVELFWYDTESGYANQVLVDNGRAFLGAHLDTPESLIAFDVTDPHAIVKGGVLDRSIQFLAQIAARDLSVQGDTLYIHGEWNIVSVDVSDIRNLKILQFQRLDSGSGDISGNLFVTSTNRQHYFVDVLDPYDMRVLSELPGDTGGEGAIFIDPQTVIISSNSGVRVVDVSDPANPAVISTLTLSGSIMGFSRDGDVVYMAAKEAGVHAVDVSDSKKLKLIETIKTPGSAWGCYARGDLLVVADNMSGLTVFQRGEALEMTIASDAVASTAQTPLTLNRKYVTDSEEYFDIDPRPLPDMAYAVVVTSAADSGLGTLRDALTDLSDNTTITFDTSVFQPDSPATIALSTVLPVIERDYITIDASNAGVILDGSRVQGVEGQGEGAVNGFHMMGFYGKIMGLQIVNFPDCGIRVDGPYAQVGGNRDTGAGPTGQGNQIGGCRMGILDGGWGSAVLGNLVGVNAGGTAAMRNEFTNVFITGDRITVGGTAPGEANVISGSGYSNLTCWGDHVRIIGNLIGTDVTGTMPIDQSTMFNVLLEYGTTNTIVGGAAPGEGNILSGAQYGVVFSDQNTYQCSVIGNYIGTDITGTQAVPNSNGLDSNVSGYHRIGGKNPGEGNVISGNNGCGVGIRQNIIVIGNTVGYAADGETPLPNDTGISLYSGSVIGGYTPPEGNRVLSKTFAVRSAMQGAAQNYIAGNTFVNEQNSGLWIEAEASRNFIQNNRIACYGKNQFAVFIDGGTGNCIRGNTIQLDKREDMIALLHHGNLDMPAPAVTSVSKKTVKGTACAFGLVEIYLYANGEATPIGHTVADGKGKFTFEYLESLKGKKIILLATDEAGNTSGFSKAYTGK